MKKLLSVLFLSMLIFLLIGCQEKMKGTEELIEKAREEISVAEADTIEIKYAGSCIKDETALLWFVSGNEYQAHTYLPMEFEIVGEEEYTFVHTYKPLERGEDIVALQWKDGYAFLINNPDCRTLKIKDQSGGCEITIEENEYPYIYYNELIPSQYQFFDIDGNEIF